MIIGHFNKENTGQETSVTNMKKVMVIGGGTDTTWPLRMRCIPSPLSTTSIEIDGTQLCGNWHYDEVESMMLNGVEYSIGTYGTSDGTAIGMAARGQRQRDR